MQRGFSLLELLVVLAVLGLVALVVPTAWRAVVPSAKLTAQAEELVKELRSSRAQSLSTQFENRFYIDLGRKRFGCDVESFQLDGDIEIEFKTARREVGSNDRASILFLPDGTTTGGEIRLKLDELTKLIEIDWLTGRISIND